MSRSIRTGLASAAILGLVLTGCARDSDAPAFDDIEPTMWESMSNADAMAMTAVLPESMADDPMIEEILGGNLSNVEIYGSLNESATAMRLGEGEDPIVLFFGEDVYVSMETMWETMGSYLLTEAPAEQREMIEQMAAGFEGKYLELSAEYDINDTVDMSEVLEEMRSAAEEGRADEVTGFNFSELQPEGEYARLDMETEETGWYYATQEMEEGDIMNGQVEKYIAIPTDRETPRLDQIREGDHKMEFFWNDEVDIPERPTEDQLITEEDFMSMAP